MTNKPHRYLSLTETARRFGISPKALRLYEARGLVIPERTAADWRVYGPLQITRLQQVIALKSFGLSLGRIGELMSGRTAGLDDFLALHEALLTQQRESIERALQLVKAARTKLGETGHLSSDELIDLTRNTVMTNPDSLKNTYESLAAKYLTPEDHKTLEANGFAGMDQPDATWDSLNLEAKNLILTHAAPDSDEAVDLAVRWMAQVNKATGNNPQLNLKLRDLAREALETQAFADASPSSLTITDYIQKAYAAAIDRGLMPRP
ncbi:MerR family transcriptional regulator [Asticcacaulis tiandongensis]|uniref:MerR family transcriptional regulator n=1 Tax=Asticcacaulis tiandongensis TaxID=2565365 RepID=UPI0011263DDA|nr:MerR family transcriptional regulator [Asticcacaulis tiandongensis]